MQTRTLSRELALFVLGQCAERERSSAVKDNLETLLQKALDSLMQHWREVLDHCAGDLEKAQQSLLDSELQDGSASTDLVSVRGHLRDTLTGAGRFLMVYRPVLSCPVYWRLLIRSKFVRKPCVESSWF